MFGTDCAGAAAPFAPPGSPPAPAGTAPAGTAPDQAIRLQRLAELRDRGVISPADYEAERTRILSGY